MDQMMSKINELHRRMDAFIATNNKKNKGQTQQQQISKLVNGTQNGHSTPVSVNSLSGYPTLCSELSSLVENLSDEKSVSLLEV